jgi:hypothetical protein
MIDPSLEPQARRLALAAALTGQTRQRLGGRIPLGSTAADLIALARRLGKEIRSFERTYHLRFEPTYPGVTPGPEPTGNSVRLALACAAFHADGTPLGVVWTTLIPGRFVQVSVAPAETPIPDHWQPLQSF